MCPGSRHVYRVGIHAGDLAPFALIAATILYFKVDDSNRRGL
jgi:hypothetical protein